MKITFAKLEDTSTDFKITISEYHTDSNDIFYFHKTTNRDLYERELKRVRENGFYEVIFSNEKDEITEGSITNIYIERDGSLYTPPVECGLLNGTTRQYMMNKLKIKEKIITLKELMTADVIYISNSIIGFQKAFYMQRSN